MNHKLDQTSQNMDAIANKIDEIKNQELSGLNAARLSGIAIIPNELVQKPTLLVPFDVWEKLLEKYGKTAR